MLLLYIIIHTIIIYHSYYDRDILYNYMIDRLDFIEIIRRCMYIYLHLRYVYTIYIYLIVFDAWRKHVFVSFRSVLCYINTSTICRERNSSRQQASCWDLRSHGWGKGVDSHGPPWTGLCMDVGSCRYAGNDVLLLEWVDEESVHVYYCSSRFLMDFRWRLVVQFHNLKNGWHPDLRNTGVDAWMDGSYRCTNSRMMGIVVPFEPMESGATSLRTNTPSLVVVSEDWFWLVSPIKCWCFMYLEKVAS